MLSASLLVLLTAVGALIGVIRAVEGLEFGSMAAWFSGIASSTAVWIALSRNSQIDAQRQEDRIEKRRAAAYQAYIKLDQLILQLYSAHYYLRTAVAHISIFVGEKDYKVSFVSDNPTLATIKVRRFNEAEENLLAGGEALGLLSQVQECFDQFHAFQTVMVNLRPTQLEIEKTGVANVSSDGRVVVGLDTGTTQGQNLILDAHHNYGAMCAIVTAALPKAILLRQEVRSKLSVHFERLPLMSINETALQAEVGRGLPDLGVVGLPRSVGCS